MQEQQLQRIPNLIHTLASYTHTLRTRPASDWKVYAFFHPLDQVILLCAPDALHSALLQPQC